MQLRAAAPNSPQWDQGRQFLRELAVITFTPNRSRHNMWLLEATTGGTFDEVTEQVTGRDLGAVMLAQEGYLAAESIIAVHPDYRRQRWGYRLLNWLLNSGSCDAIYGEVHTMDHAAMAFAAKYGQFEGAVNHNGLLLAHVRFSYDAPGWPHPGCRCNTCIADLNSLTNPTRRRR